MKYIKLYINIIVVKMENMKMLMVFNYRIDRYEKINVKR